MTAQVLLALAALRVGDVTAVAVVVALETVLTVASVTVAVLAAA